MSLKRTISKCTMEGGTVNLCTKKLIGHSSTNSKEDEDEEDEDGVHLFHSPPWTKDDEPITTTTSLPHVYPSHYYRKNYISNGSYVSPSPPQYFYPSRRSSCSSTTSSSSLSLSSSSISMNSDLDNFHRVANLQEKKRTNRLSTIFVVEKVLDYIDEMCRYYDKAQDITFAHLAHMLNSIPTACCYVHTLLKEKIGIPFPHVSGFVVNVKCFIVDEDIREVTIAEAALFLRHFLSSLTNCTMNLPNLLEDVARFFQVILDNFKDYVLELWLKMKKIKFPCEFGKKSDNLFLCMECHREHC